MKFLIDLPDDTHINFKVKCAEERRTMKETVRELVIRYTKDKIKLN